MRAPQRDSRAQPSVALGARRSRRDFVLRGQAGRRASNSSATRIRARASSARARLRAADRLRADALAQARRSGQALDVRSRGELHLDVELARQAASAEIEFIIGPRGQRGLGVRTRSRSGLSLPPLPEPELQKWLYETRAVEPSHALASRWPFAFSADGKTLHLTHRTPRPWAHVMGNEVGGSVMVSNDGEVYSAFANARQNGLTPFRFESTTRAAAGPDRLYQGPRHRRDRRAGLRAVPARRTPRSKSPTSRASRTFTKRRGDLTTHLRSLLAAGFSRRHAAADARQ